MRTSVRKWGNSRGAILPLAALADQPGFELGDELEVVKVDGGILLKPAAPAYTLEELLAGDSPELYALNDEDRAWDNMQSVGAEILK